MSPAQSIPRRGYIIVDKDNPPGPSGAIRIFSNDQMWSAPEKVSQIKCIFESLFWLLSQGVAVRLLVFCFQRRCHWAGIYWAFSLLTVLRFRPASKMLKKNLLQKAILSSQQNSRHAVAAYSGPMATPWEKCKTKWLAQSINSNFWKPFKFLLQSLPPEGQHILTQGKRYWKKPCQKSKDC